MASVFLGRLIRYVLTLVCPITIIHLMTVQHTVIPDNDLEDRERSSNPPIHYTDGAKVKF